MEKIWFCLATKVGGSKSSYMDGCLNEESMFYKMVVKYLCSARYFKDLSINRWCTLQKIKSNANLNDSANMKVKPESYIPIFIHRYIAAAYDSEWSL